MSCLRHAVHAAKFADGAGAPSRGSRVGTDNNPRHAGD